MFESEKILRRRRLFQFPKKLYSFGYTFSKCHIFMHTNANEFTNIYTRKKAGKHTGTESMGLSIQTSKNVIPLRKMQSTIVAAGLEVV